MAMSSIDEHAWKTCSTVLASLPLMVIGFGRTTDDERVGKTESAPAGWIADEDDEDILLNDADQQGNA